MFDFVNEMSNMDQILWYIGFGSTVFFVGQLSLMFIGGDSDASSDTGDDVDGGDDASSFKILTLKNIVGFLIGFGWGGLALHIDGGMSESATLIGATLIGIGIMFLYSTVFWLMFKLHSPNEETLDDAIGNTGKVYLGIPAGGTGKVTLTVNGRVSTMNAIAENGVAIDTHAQVEVVRVLNSELVVKEVKLVNLNASAT